MTQHPTILFLCEQGAAKSVVAAAHFNKLAVEKKLNARAVARGTTPDAELSPKTVEGLKKDGLTPTETIPQRISLTDVESATRIVTFCELPEEYQSKSIVEEWDGVPPVSEDYEKARDEILERLNQLIKQM